MRVSGARNIIFRIPLRSPINSILNDKAILLFFTSPLPFRNTPFKNFISHQWTKKVFSVALTVNDELYELSKIRCR